MAKQIEPIDNLEDLVAFLEKESVRRKKADRLLRFVIAAVLGLAFLAIVVAWVRLGHYPGDMATSFSSFAGLSGMGVAVSSRHKDALRAAKEFDDPRLIPYLVEVLAVQQSRIPDLAREVLVDKLPKVTRPGDLPVETRRRLATALSVTRDMKFLRAALVAIHASGEAESILPLESFIHKTPLRNRREAEKFKDQARLALGDIRMRAASKVIQAKEAETTEILGQLLPQKPAIEDVNLQVPS